MRLKVASSSHFPEAILRSLRILPLVLCSVYIGISSAQVSANDQHNQAQQQESSQVANLFQVSTLDALSQGLFDGVYTVRDLKRAGDFGLGTYDGLNGEMVVLDGHVYHGYADGTTQEAKDSETAPFAAVTFFKPQSTFSLTGKTMAEITTALTAALPSANLNYAIRISGHFTSVETRAIAKQLKPYPTLATAAATQNLFFYTDLDGTAVVLRGPAFEKGINVVGDHFHFVSKDHTKSGHVITLTTGTVKVEVMLIPTTTLWLPLSNGFLNATLPYGS